MAMLPHGDRATVPADKLAGYLLSEAHPVGRTKAALFVAAGYSAASAQLLEQDLLVIARTAEVVEQVESSHGVKYVVDGPLATPVGGTIWLRTVWIVESGMEYPRFVTAYPAPQGRVH